MSTLQQRLEELMQAMNWEHNDLVRVSKQTHSVVSQWLGHSSKVIKSIGKLEAALYLERASGYSALWIAKGIGAKMVDRPPAYRVAMPGQATETDDADLLARFGKLLARVPAQRRRAFGETLRGWADEGGAVHYQGMLLTLLEPERKAANGK